MPLHLLTCLGFGKCPVQSRFDCVTFLDQRVDLISDLFQGGDAAVEALLGEC